MGTVVTLPPRRATRAFASRDAEATILLFMGVRYVRDSEPEQSVDRIMVDPEPDAEHDLPLEIA